MPFALGQLSLDSNLFLSPLAGYTNLPFRLIIREIGGAGLCTTDLVNARSLLEKKSKALKLIETAPAHGLFLWRVDYGRPGSATAAHGSRPLAYRLGDVRVNAE